MRFATVHPGRSIYVWFCCSRRLADKVLDVYSSIVHSKMSEDAEMRV